LRADGVVRPLIDCRRADVLAFAVERAGEIAHDPSNADRAFTRVRVREELLPVLLREDPQALSHLAALADDARDALAMLEPQIRERVAMIRASCHANSGSKPGGMFDLSCLRDDPRALRRLALKAWLAELIGERGLTRAHIESLEHALTRDAEVWLPCGWTALGSGDGYLSVTIDGDRLNQ
jgi:tRNA(Ile)-lysidine synthase